MMMRELALLLPVLLVVFPVATSCSSTTPKGADLSDVLPVKNGKVTYSGVVQTAGVSKEELYKRAKQWFLTGKTPAVSSRDDKQGGRVYGEIHADDQARNTIQGTKQFQVDWNGTFYGSGFAKYVSLSLAFTPKIKITAKQHHHQEGSGPCHRADTTCLLRYLLKRLRTRPSRPFYCQKWILT